MTYSSHANHDLANGGHDDGIEMRQGQQPDLALTSRAHKSGGRRVSSLIFRTCGLLLTIVYLAFFIRYQIAFHNLIVVAYIASVWCILTDTWEIYTLSRARTGRLPASALITLDVFGSLLIGPFTLTNFFLRTEGISIVPADGPDSHKPLQRVVSDAEASWSLSCLGITAVASAFRLVMVIIVCCVCCQDRRRRSASTQPRS